jgi:hypothetical protein
MAQKLGGHKYHTGLDEFGEAIRKYKALTHPMHSNLKVTFARILTSSYEAKIFSWIGRKPVDGRDESFTRSQVDAG